MKPLPLRALAILLVLMLSFTLLTQMAAADTVYVSGHGHIDTGWQWPYKTTISELIFDTYKNQLDLMDNNDGFKFGSSSPLHYAWAKEYYPNMYERIKNYVAEGRWDIIGGEWVESETMIPSAESHVRQFLYGQRFYREEFGDIATIAFLPDDPSHSWSLPQIMAKSGIKGFTATRVSVAAWGGRTGDNNGHGGMSGHDSFIWKGPDGTELLSYKPTPFYNTGMSNSTINSALSDNKSIGINKGMFYYGNGDMGGGPTQAHINSAKAAQDNPDMPDVVFARLSDYFDSITPDDIQKIKDRPVNPQGEALGYTNTGVWEDELYYNHEVGLYTSHSEMKKYNNDNEVTAEAAEKLASVTSWLGATSYPQVKLTNAWKKVLQQQHHDVLPGCSVRSVYTDAWNDYEIALNHFNKTIDYSMTALASRADTSGADGHIPVLVFNSLSFERTEVVETDIVFDSEPAAVRIYNSAGVEIPSQSKINGRTATVTFIAENVPSVGYAVYQAEAAATPGNYITGLSITKNGDNIIENSRYRVEINDATGNVKSIIDKQNGNKNVLQDGEELEFHIYNDVGAGDGGSWNHWVMDWVDISSIPRVINNPESINIVESGPVKSTFEIVKRFRDNTSQSEGPSTISQYVTLYSNSDRVDIHLTVDWHEWNRCLKASFPLAVRNSKATYDLGYGTIERGNRNPSMKEVAAQKWADMTDQETGGYGVSILSENKYGWDKYEATDADSTPHAAYKKTSIRLTLLRAPKGDLGPDNTTDMGIHNINYSIYPHENGWSDANTPQQAESFTKRLLAWQTTQHEGDLGRSFSFVQTSAGNVRVAEIKKAEDDDDLIVRLYEETGRDVGDVTVTFPSNIVSVVETNLIEDVIADAPAVTPVGNTFKTDVGHYELKTFKVRLAKPGYYEDTRPVSMPVDLSGYYNVDGVTFDTDPVDGSLDINGNTIPGELYPVRVVSEDVRFQMGPTASGAKNVLQAEKQTISLSAPGANFLYFLANSTGDAQDEDFKVTYAGGSTDARTIRVSAGYDAIGSWKTGDFTRNTDNLGHFFTHMHTPNGNEAYKHLHLFVYRMALDPDKTVESVTLPLNMNIKIYAMTASSGGFLPQEDNATYEYDNDTYTMIDDRNSALKYVGGWTTNGANPDYYNGTFSYMQINANTNQSSVTAYAEMDFYGTGIDILGDQGFNSADFKVYLDGEYHGLADCFYGTSSADNNHKRSYEMYRITGLNPAVKHTIRLAPVMTRSSQEWAMLDAFRVHNAMVLPVLPTPPEYDPYKIDDKDMGIVYEGNWEEVPSTLSYGGSTHQSSTKGDSVSHSFVGSSIQVFCITGPDMGTVEIYLDNELVSALNCATFNTSYHRSLYYMTGLEMGLHNIRLVIKSGTFAFDSFRVFTIPEPPENAIMISNNNPNITQTSWNQNYGSREAGPTYSINNSVRASNAANGSLTLTFWGTGIYIFNETYSRQSGDGPFDIYIDDIKVQTWSDHTATRVNRQLVFAQIGLDPGVHTIKMVNLESRWAMVDAFFVSQNLTGTVSGFVKDGITGKPVKDAIARIESEGREYTAVTNGSGLYKIADVPANKGGTDYTVQVTHPNYQDAAPVPGVDLLLYNDIVPVGDIILERKGNWAEPGVDAEILACDVGDSVSFNVTVGDGGTKAVSTAISSSDETIATVDRTSMEEDGSVNVALLRQGQAKITVTFDLADGSQVAKEITVSTTTGKILSETAMTVTADKPGTFKLYMGDAASALVTAGNTSRTVISSKFMDSYGVLTEDDVITAAVGPQCGTDTVTVRFFDRDVSWTPQSPGDTMPAGQYDNPIATRTISMAMDPAVPVFNAHPQNRSATSGTVGITARASVLDGGSVTYSWQRSTDGGDSWNAATGASTWSTVRGPAALLTSANISSSTSGYMYRVIATNTRNGRTTAATSKPGTVTMYEAANITGQPQNQTATAGGKATFAVTAGAPSVGTLTYYWQRSTAPGGSEYAYITGAPNAPSYTTPELKGSDSGYLYRCAIQANANGAASNTTSDAAGLTVIVPITGITLDKTSMAITMGATGSLTAALEPADAAQTGLVWTISDTSVATISASGAECTVMPVSTGTATIRAESSVNSDIYAECELLVKEPITAIPITAIALNKTEITLDLGEEETLSVSFTPENTTDSKEVLWESSDPDIAAVDENGKVAPLSAGTATITATSAANSELRATCVVTVKPVNDRTITEVGEIESITVNYGTAKEAAGLPSQVEATLDDSSVMSVDVDWDEGEPEYDANTPGTYVFTGTPINLPGYVTNPGGLTATASVTVAEPAGEAANPAISPTMVSFDLDAPADVTTIITWNDAASVTGAALSPGMEALSYGTDYTVDGNVLTVSEGYLSGLDLAEDDSIDILIYFDVGDPAVLTVDAVSNYMPGSDATLNSLKAGGVTLEGFAPDKYEYTTELPYGTSPGALTVIVSATPNDPKATVSITQASTLPGSATVLVTAEDGTPATYTVYFTLAEEEPQLTVHTITAGAGAHGSISPAGAVTVNDGESRTFTFTPDNGYKVNNVTVDGRIVTASGSYTFKNVTGDHTITVTFARVDRSSGAGSGASQPSKPPVQGPKVEGDRIVFPEPEVNNGVAESTVTAGDFAEALGNAQLGRDGTKTVIISVPAANGAQEYRQTLPAPVVTSGADTWVEIQTDIANLEVPGNMFSNTGVRADTVTLSVARADRSALAPEVAAQVGDRPVIGLNAYDGNEKVSWSNSDAPVKITVKYVPENEDELANSEFITIWYIDGSGNAVPVTNARYNAQTGEITFEVTHFSTYAAVYVHKTFGDLEGYGWAKHSIEVMASKGIVYGTAADSFGPSGKITRADFLNFLMSALDLHADFSGNFSDVDSAADYYDAVGAARELGIVYGVGGDKFEPATAITRQDMMVIVARALKLAKGQEEGAMEDLAAYADASQISDYARAAAAAMVKTGIIQGSDGRILPFANTTRAEAATIMYRLYNK